MEFLRDARPQSIAELRKLLGLGADVTQHDSARSPAANKESAGSVPRVLWAGLAAGALVASALAGYFLLREPDREPARS